MLAATIDSVRAGGGDPEIIVIDDASTDNTPAICARIPNLNYIRLATQVGTAAARNRGIAVAAGEFVTFVDDDDLRLPNSFPPQIALLEAHADAAFCYARMLIGDSRFGLPTGQITPDVLPHGDIYWPLLEGNFVPGGSVVARKSAIVGCGGFDERLRTMEDYDLWVRLADGHTVVAYFDPVTIYRKSSLTSRQKTSDRIWHGRNRRVMINRLLSGPRARSNLIKRRAVLTKHIRGVYLSLITDALNADSEGQSDVALAYLSQARTYAFAPIKAWITTAMLLAIGRHRNART